MTHQYLCRSLLGAVLSLSLALTLTPTCGFAQGLQHETHLGVLGASPRTLGGPAKGTSSSASPYVIFKAGENPRPLCVSVQNAGENEVLLSVGPDQNNRIPPGASQAVCAPARIVEVQCPASNCSYLWRVDDGR